MAVVACPSRSETTLRSTPADQCQARVGVPEIVEADDWQAGRPSKHVEVFGDESRADDMAVHSGEVQAGLGPRGAGHLALALLCLAVAPQACDGLAVEGHDTRAALGPGGSHRQPAADVHDLPHHEEGLTVNIDVLPPRADHLAAA